MERERERRGEERKGKERKGKEERNWKKTGNFNFAA